MAIPVPTNNLISINGKGLDRQNVLHISHKAATGPPGQPDHAFRYFRFYVNGAGENKPVNMAGKVRKIENLE
jgi:hypothetical protein